MGNIDLTKIEENISGPFEHLHRLDRLYIASKLDNDSQVDWIVEQGFPLAIDMKEAGETNYHDKEKIEAAGILYYHFPVSNLDEISFDQLVELSKVINSTEDKVFIYCMSGNRVAAVLALVQSLVCGHPKKRAYEMACRVGMTKEGLKEKVRSRFNL